MVRPHLSVVALLFRLDLGLLQVSELRRHFGRRLTVFISYSTH